MKLTQALALITVTTGLGIAGVVTLPGNTTQAAAKSTLKTFPKAFRHNWYTSAGKRGNAMKIKAKKVAMRYDTNTSFAHFTLHAHKLPFPNNKNKYNGLWIYAKKQHGTIHIGLWNKSVTLPLEGSYRVRNKTYRNRKIKVLQEVSGGHVDSTYYTTKKLAAHFNK
ncbi:hypothetical protein [Levilactobacillus mulengensis]|uniref:hypothetical protein n=1 Tax=Levilactobacillus mulengensis TaxID=2486025 RepID=UPI000F78331D|nr:hypothetical protein [Levilactobacillus mulengensis]